MNRKTLATIAAVVFVTSSACALGAGLEIEEKYDEFTKQHYLQSERVKVCQPKSAGMAAQCAGLFLAWDQQYPDYVTVRVELIDVMAIDAIAFNIDGQIVRHDAANELTRIEYDGQLAWSLPSLAMTSSNVFAIPVDELQAVADSDDNGIVQLSGLDAAMNLDFYRKAGFGKALPADKLQEFLSRIATEVGTGEAPP